MTERGRRLRSRTLLTALLGATLALGTAALPGPAGAATPAAAPSAAGATTATGAPTATGATSLASRVDCAPTGTLAARRVDGLDGVVRGPEPSEATVARYERDLERRLDAVGAARVSPRVRGDIARKPVTVKVFVHVIKPSARKKGVSRAAIRRQIKVMNRAYAGKQWRKAKRTRFRFKVKKVDYTVDKRWYYASLGSKASAAMRKKLHRGAKRDLNLYFNEPTERGGLQVLGYSTFPQRPKSKVALDGVVIHRGSMPGGRFRGYNKGDTAVHEVGHWLGLLHTFHGACGRKGDRVADTPKERIPSFECPKGRDTCPAPGKDPIHNFMNYSFDRCMNHFTPGQIARMRTLWRVYRR